MEPSLDLGMLERLRRDLGDEVAWRFACTYVRLLPGRLDGMQDALARRDPLGAARIAADLRTASSMLGAVRLARLAELAQRRLQSGEIDQASVSTLRCEATEVAATLLRVIGHSPSR